MHFRAQASLPFIAGLLEQASSIIYPLNSAANAPSAPAESRAMRAIPLFMSGLLRVKYYQKNVVPKTDIVASRHRTVAEWLKLRETTRNACQDCSARTSTQARR